jgi:adenosylhomocysteine nucleosidase
MHEIIQATHRKLLAFEMENYALFESSRLSTNRPITFAVKCVVDNGNSIKNDRFQDIGSQIAASTVYHLIKGIM